MVFLEKLHNWMDEANLTESEKDLLIGYAIRAAFERTSLIAVCDQQGAALINRIKEMDNYSQLETIIEESFDVNSDPEPASTESTI